METTIIQQHPNPAKLNPQPESGITRNDTEEEITVSYSNRFTVYAENETDFKTVSQKKEIKTNKNVPKLGVMLVGLGGNNGSTFTAGVIANKKKIRWDSRNGEVEANMYGSFTQSATCHVGFKYSEEDGTLSDVHKPVKDLLPMVDPVDFEITGWDINGANLYEAAKRSHVLEPALIEQLKDDLEAIKPLSAALNPDFIAANQSERTNNIFHGTNQEVIDKLRKDIQEHKKKCDKVIVLWTANTEMYLLPEIAPVDDLEQRIATNQPLPASILYTIACI